MMNYAVEPHGPFNFSKPSLSVSSVFTTSDYCSVYPEDKTSLSLVEDDFSLSSTVSTNFDVSSQNTSSALGTIELNVNILPDDKVILNFLYKLICLNLSAYQIL